MMTEIVLINKYFSLQKMYFLGWLGYFYGGSAGCSGRAKAKSGGWGSRAEAWPLTGALKETWKFFEGRKLLDCREKEMFCTKLFIIIVKIFVN